MNSESRRNPNALFESHLARALDHSAKNKKRQALREFREAARIRPSESSLKNTIRILEDEMSKSVEIATPFERIASPFNLSVRYWDSGMQGAALKECYRALDELSKAGLPVTCARHNLEIMKLVVPRTRRQESDLRRLISGGKKNNLPVNYKLATLYFDRRMLQVADKQLTRCKELSQTLLELEHTRRAAAVAARTTRECDSRCSSRRGSLVEEEFSIEYDETRLAIAKEKLSGILDDMTHVRELQSLYCTLTNEVKILPCLLSRFREDVSECEEWWAEIRSSTKLIW